MDWSTILELKMLIQEAMLDKFGFAPSRKDIIIHTLYLYGVTFQVKNHYYRLSYDLDRSYDDFEEIKEIGRNEL